MGILVVSVRGMSCETSAMPKPLVWRTAPARKTATRHPGASVRANGAKMAAMRPSVEPRLALDCAEASMPHRTQTAPSKTRRCWMDSDVFMVASYQTGPGHVLNLRNPLEARDSTTSSELPVGGGALLERAPEIAVHVALVTVSRAGGNLGEGKPSVVQQASSALGAQAADVLADRASEPGSERAGYIDGVQPDSVGELTQRLRAGLIVQQVARAREPAIAGLRAGDGGPRQLSE